MVPTEDGGREWERCEEEIEFNVLNCGGTVIYLFD